MFTMNVMTAKGQQEARPNISLSEYDNQEAKNSKSARTSAEKKRLLLQNFQALLDELEEDKEAEVHQI